MLCCSFPNTEAKRANTVKCTLCVNDLNAEGNFKNGQKITSRDQRPSYEASIVALRHFIQLEGLFRIFKTDLYRPYLLSQLNTVHSPVTQFHKIHFNITIPSTIRFSIRSVTLSLLSTRHMCLYFPRYFPIAHGKRIPF